MSLSDWIAAWIRTQVAVWVPVLAAWLASLGVEVPVEPTTMVLVSAIITAYYTVVRLLEARWPAIGVLLGWKAQPTYGSTTERPGEGSHGESLRSV